MREPVVGLVSGVLFGIGLAISGMMDPSRVRGFLDVFGQWDPTLAFVMGGAVLVIVVAWSVQRSLSKPVFGGAFNLPDKQPIDRNLIGGAVLFGVGWGLAGLCPGPALSALVIEPISASVFVASMAAGMTIHRAMST